MSCVFRCVLASLYEGLSVGPSIGPSFRHPFFKCAKTRLFDYQERRGLCMAKEVMKRARKGLTRKGVTREGRDNEGDASDGRVSGLVLD